MKILRASLSSPLDRLPILLLTMFVAACEGGLDQRVLGAEVVVERHLGDARFGQDAVDAGGVVAVAVEQIERGVDQLVAAGCSHGRVL